MSSPEHTAGAHKLSLILGIDGSGKSTIAQAIAATTGAKVHEATAGPHSKALKKKHQRLPVDADLIFERETMYAGLNSVFQQEIREHLKERDVVTAGSLLVTRLANFAMRGAICEPRSESLTDITSEWLTSSDRTPDEIIYLHAPMEVIVERLFGRLRTGDIHELPRAYNSPFYLNQYDKALGEAALFIANNSAIPVTDYDTSTLSPDEIVTAHMGPVR